MQPAWMEELKRRYLADEGNVFVLTGPAVADGTWRIDGEDYDTVAALHHLLSQSREVVGVLSPDRGLVFPGLGDEGIFERQLATQDILSGSTRVLSSRDPLQALVRIHRAATSPGPAQAWLVRGLDKIFPGHAKRISALDGAPPLRAWRHDAALRASNTLVLLLVPDVEAVHREAIGGLPLIEMRDGPAIAPTPEAVPTEEASGPASPPRSTATHGDLDRIEALLPAELERALLQHPPATHAARLPVMDATAAVIYAIDPSWCGPLTFSLDEEGGVVATGPGAEQFLDRWSRDIALDAAAGMLLRELQQRGPDEARVLDNTAVRALVRRIRKLLG